MEGAELPLGRSRRAKGMLRTMKFEVLSKQDDSDRALVSAEQRDAAAAHGFTVAEFSIDAPSRGAAMRAWDASRRGDGPTPSVEPGDDDYGLEGLTEPQRTAVVQLVVALVERDQPALEDAGAYTSGGDPYMWTAPYGSWERVDLVTPPGDPRHWSGTVLRPASPASVLEVIVDMWTAQEGPSDLSLELRLEDADGDSCRARFDNFHVM